jgi:hypothetical protein
VRRAPSPPSRATMHHQAAAPPVAVVPATLKCQHQRCRDAFGASAACCARVQ